jgi:hypothetical protein
VERRAKEAEQMMSTLTRSLLAGGAIVLGRAGFGASPLPASSTTWGTWLLVGVLAVGALMDFASPSA